MKVSHIKIQLKEKWKVVTEAVEWRIRSKIGDEAFDDAVFRLGKRFRQKFKTTQFLGVAGSVGKTTAKDLLVGILNVRGKTIGNPMSRNVAPEIARTILRTRPWHQFCVAELGETRPGSLDIQLSALLPSIGIITVVGDDHVSAFGSRQAIAREFAKLVQAIPSHGSIVLNLDDELVSGLREDAKCKVINYGTCATADLRATGIVSIWPDPLQFTATFKGESVPIRTQLHGKHLLTSALAAIGGGLAAGLSLADCAKGIGRIAPTQGRMQPVRAPQGITFIHDDFKAPAWTIEPLLDQLRDATANRKIFVLGSISDCDSKERWFSKVASKALDIADITIFYGRFASAALKARKPGTEPKLHAFTHIRDVAIFLHSIKQEGDLILLKGSENKDHLSRLSLSLSQTVNCWVDDCGRDMFCSDCSHLRTHRGPTDGVAQESADPTFTDHLSAGLPSLISTDQIIIGLGNPSTEFSGTHHNIGYESLDALCLSINSEWSEYPNAWIAQESFGDANVCLIKIKTPINLTGPVLKKLAETMHFDATQCILVFDDIDLPLGKVRTRMNGSSGGHRGVASILEAFQTDQFRRVKIGVKCCFSVDQPNPPAVLNRFDEAAYATVRQSFETVKERIYQLATQAR